MSVDESEMIPYYADEFVTIHHGDCREVLLSLPKNSIDTVITDPPYELGFMGRDWDRSGVAFKPETASTWGGLRVSGSTGRRRIGGT